MATRPDCPIQLLSNANLRKYDTAMSKATIPMRLNQRPAIKLSRSSGDAFFVPRMPCNASAGAAPEEITGAKGASRGGGGMRGPGGTAGIGALTRI